MFMRTLAVSAAVLVTGPQALAADPDRVETVTFRPADLVDAEGRAALLADVRNAAESLCREPGRRDLYRRRLENACISSVLEQAGRQIDRRLAALPDPHLPRALSIAVS
jgi:UrcA family protein